MSAHRVIEQASSVDKEDQRIFSSLCSTLWSSSVNIWKHPLSETKSLPEREVFSSRRRRRRRRRSQTSDKLTQIFA
jgi:hypothetical protein